MFWKCYSVWACFSFLKQGMYVGGAEVSLPGVNTQGLCTVYSCPGGHVMSHWAMDTGNSLWGTWLLGYLTCDLVGICNFSRVLFCALTIKSCSAVFLGPALSPAQAGLQKAGGRVRSLVFVATFPASAILPSGAIWSAILTRDCLSQIR